MNVTKGLKVKELLSNDTTQCAKFGYYRQLADTVIKGKNVLCARSQFSTCTKSYREVSIPVPWGKIAGKWWGPIETKPIICLHGIQDNCGSFDRLIPVLRNDANISFLALDFPGHGYSTPIPKGMFYEYVNYPLLLNRICDYFNWTTVSLMGHSLGAMTSFSYTILYPEKVNFLICIDALKPIHVANSAETVRKNIDLYMKYEKLNANSEEPLAYTLEEIIQKITSAHKNSVKPEVATCLLERNIAPSKKFPGKYYITRDSILKVRVMFNWLEPEQVIKDANRITHPIFVCKAARSSYYEPPENFLEMLGALRKSSQDCDFHMVEGTHHLHLNEPEKVGILIKKFLSKHYQPEASNLNSNSLFCETPASPITFQSQM